MNEIQENVMTQLMATPKMEFAYRSADQRGSLLECRADLKKLTSTQIPGYPRTASIAAGLDKLKAIPVCSPWVQAAETRRGQAHGYASTGFTRQTESGGLSIRQWPHEIDRKRNTFERYAQPLELGVC